MSSPTDLILTIETTSKLLFEETHPIEGSFTAPVLTRKVNVGPHRTAVLQEFPRNRNGGSSGEQVLSIIDETVLPPEVITLTMGSHLGVLVCESANPEVATDIRARMAETWHGVESPRGEPLLRLFSQSFVSGLYTM